MTDRYLGKLNKESAPWMLIVLDHEEKDGGFGLAPER
jgi:hypothetical protein